MNLKKITPATFILALLCLFIYTLEWEDDRWLIEDIHHYDGSI